MRYTSQAASCVLPLLVILVGFKFYCRKVFDAKIRYHTKGPDPENMLMAGTFARKDKLDKRYGHPSLYRPLITPMVHAKARNVLSQVYYGRINSEPVHNTKYGDISMDNMQRGKAGQKQLDSLGGQFEIVEEADMDFMNYKHRAEFSAEHGGRNAYGPDSDVYSDTGTPIGFRSPASSRPGTPQGFGRAAPSPLALSTTGYGGADYYAVPNPAPSPGEHLPRSSSPYLGDRVSMLSPDGPEPAFDWNQHDSHSETGSITHLLRDQHAYVPGPSSQRGQFPQYPQQPHDSHEEYRGVHR